MIEENTRLTYTWCRRILDMLYLDCLPLAPFGVFHLYFVCRLGGCRTDFPTGFWIPYLCAKCPSLADVRDIADKGRLHTNDYGASLLSDGRRRPRRRRLGRLRVWVGEQ